MATSLLKDKIDELTFLKERYEAELKTCPPGTLAHIFEGQKYHRYFQVLPKRKNGKCTRRRINNKKNLLRALARKSFLLIIIQHYETCIRHLKQTADLIPEFDTPAIIRDLRQKYPSIPPECFLSPVNAKNTRSISGFADNKAAAFADNRAAAFASNRAATFAANGISKEIFEWANQPYKKNSTPFTNAIYTSKGLRVRSKNELLIIEKLYHYNIPFRYDQLVNIGGHTIAPDITLCNNIGELLFWEHFGMMHDKDYQDSYFYKRNIYESNHFNLWNNLICTFSEDNDLNLALIDSVIQHRVLPWMLRETPIKKSLVQ